MKKKILSTFLIFLFLGCSDNSITSSEGSRVWSISLSVPLAHSMGRISFTGCAPWALRKESVFVLKSLEYYERLIPMRAWQKKSFSWNREAHSFTEPPSSIVWCSKHQAPELAPYLIPFSDLDRLLGFIGPSPLPFWIRVSELHSILSAVVNRLDVTKGSPYCQEEWFRNDLDCPGISQAQMRLTLASKQQHNIGLCIGIRLYTLRNWGNMLRCGFDEYV